VHSSADPRPAARDDETDLAQALARAGIRCSGDPVTLGRHADRPVTRWSTTRGDLVAKVYPSADTAARAYDITMALWHSSFGARRSPPGLAEPVLHLADCAAVVCRHVPGDPLPGNSAAALQPWLPSVGALLADLHNSRCGLPRRRDARAMLRSMTRKAADLEATPLGPATLRVAALLHMVAIDRPAPERRLVPTHGDAAPHNLLAAGGLRMLDWDRAAMADPARDLAHFVATLWAGDVVRGRPASWSALTTLVTPTRAGASRPTRSPWSCTWRSHWSVSPTAGPSSVRSRSEPPRCWTRRSGFSYASSRGHRRRRLSGAVVTAVPCDTSAPNGHAEGCFCR
jgi:hypothetical protein